MSNTEIPKALVDQIKEGNVVLFLGAGSSFGATNEKGKKIPSGNELSELLVDKYLGPEYSGISLLKAAELSISQSTLFAVQDYIASVLTDYQPAEFHLKLPTFLWTAIYTTNFDLVIERAYDKVDKRLQKLEPFIKRTDRIDEKLKNPDAIPYTKLHGCITYTRDEQVPLILSVEQYVSHRKGREFLFERFSHHAAQFPVVYVGSKLEDSDIRAVLSELREKNKVLPRSYIVLPGMKPAEKTFWESRSLSCIDMEFEEFIKEIDKAIPEQDRKAGEPSDEYEHPICKRFKKGGREVPERVKLLLTRDVEYVDASIKPTELSAQQFYKGHYRDFTPIMKGYDIQRNITDNVISEVLIAEESEKDNIEELYLVKGHAGSGKTVLLRRMAWDSSVEFNRLCLWLKSDLFPEYDAIVDLYRLCEERIFIFADPIHKYQEVIQHWLNKAIKDKVPLTIIGAERNHEWNTSCRELYPYVSEIYDLEYLGEKEIEELISKLKGHKALGYLETLSFEKQKEEFIKRAGRQLLVALYEVTLGKSFEEIISDEFKSISSIEAKSMYLTICVLHRLGAHVRAGIVSRIHGITFEEFKEKFFEPLEFIVFTYEDRIIRDHIYVSRHPIVAEMVFEQILTNEDDRYNEYIRLIKSMDTGYSSDRDSFIKLINARQLMQTLKNPQLIRRLFEEAKDRYGEEPPLLQQEAIFEMVSTDGSIDKAGDLLRKAHAGQPHNRIIKHSLAEWALRKAEKAKTQLEKNKYKKESIKISRELLEGDVFDHYPFHTLIKIGLEELRELIETDDRGTIERKIAEVERIIAQAKQAFPDETMIIAEESKFCEYLNNRPKARGLLEQAFSSNKGNTFIAIRLSNQYEEENPEKAIEILSECVDAKPYDKPANFNLAMLLRKYAPGKMADIKTHLRRSFTKGDSNYAAQFWYARCLYIEDPKGEGSDIFRRLGKERIDPEVKNTLRGIIKENGKPVIFKGVLNNLELNYGFIRRDGYQDNIFVHRGDVNGKIWQKLTQGKRVCFEMGFSYKGPRANNLTLE